MKIIYSLLLFVSILSCNERPSENLQQDKLPEKPKVNVTYKKQSDLEYLANKVKKVKLNNVQKGVAIGAVSGAAVGAAVAKNNRLGGAVIGSAAGAGAGALTATMVENKKTTGKFFKKPLFKKNKE